MKSLNMEVRQYLMLTFITAVTSQSYLTANYEIPEEMTAQTLVGNVDKTSGLSNKYNDSILSKLKYRILQSSSNGQEYFSLRESSGQLYTSSKIDRDELCPNEVLCLLKFDVIVQPPDYYHLIKVTVEISDINDNAPAFPENIIKRTVSEIAQEGFKIMLPHASDPDSPANGISGYHLDAPNSPFKLIHDQNSDQSLYLEVVSELDREIQERYILKLIAKDAGNPPRETEVTIDVTISDVNDNIPKFVKPLYDVYVNESAPVNSVLVKVQATDDDSGDNGKIVYKFSSESESSFGSMFRLNAQTGEIVLIKSLDFQLGGTYSLIVLADDGGQNSLQGQTKVIIHVSDLNNHPPHVTVSGFSASGKVEVPESAKKGTIVATISASDQDSGKNGQITCTLRFQAYFKLEYILDNQYQLATLEKVDYESQKNFTVTLDCQDFGTPSLSTSKEIVVQVLDQNDHEPVFERNEYQVTMFEENEIGLSILKVSATDRDSGINGRVTYSMDKQYRSLFEVNSDGIIRAISPLDRETAPEYQFAVWATDQGSPPLSSSAAIRIILVDINDCPPRFTVDFYEIDVVENQATHTTIGKVNATDDDSDKYNKFYFSLSHNEDSLLPFTIDPEDGTISALKSLNREEREEYRFEVVARDAMDFSLSSKCPITIVVEDMNDNVPDVSFPSPHNNTVYIPDDTPVGTTITSIVASDQDIDDNAKLSYKILSQTNEKLFYIDSATGEILVNGSLLTHAEELHNLAIVVEDSGQPMLSSIANLNIIINESLSTLSEQSHWHTQQNIIIISAICILTIVSVLVLVLAIFHFRNKANSNAPKNDPETPLKTVQGGLYHSQKQSVDLEVTAPSNQRVIVKYHVQEPLAQSTPSQGPVGDHFSTSYPSNYYNQHQLGMKDLDLSMGDRDSESASSNADSGRGTSDEGDSRGIVDSPNSKIAPVMCQFVKPEPRPLLHGKGSVRFKLPLQHVDLCPEKAKPETDLQMLRKLKPKSKDTLHTISKSVTDQNANRPIVTSHTPSLLTLTSRSTCPGLPPRHGRIVTSPSLESLSSDGASTTSGSYIIDLTEVDFNSSTISGMLV